MNVHRLFDGYNQLMRWLTRLGFFILIFAAVLFIITVVPQQVEKVNIPFSTQDGLTGTILFSQPGQVRAGDNTLVTALVEIFDSKNNLSPLVLTARLETGVESIEPRGEIQVGIQSGVPVRLEWKLKTSRQAIYPGTLWLYASSGSNRTLLLAREMKLDSRLILGVVSYKLRIALGFIASIGLILLLIGFFMSRKLKL